MAAAMVPLVAMASIEISAPRNPSSSARRASKAGIAVSSLALSGTASWLSTNRLVVAKAATRWFGASPVARSWLRRAGFAVDGDHVRTARPGLAHPGRKGCLKQRRVDPVHQDGSQRPPGTPWANGAERRSKSRCASPQAAIWS
jgi:hypothetical protein